MTRRRRRYRAPATRAAAFAPAVALPAWGWSSLGEPLHLYGLGIMTVLALLVVPGALLLAFFLPGAWTGCVPCRWRKAHRQRHGRQRCRSAYIPVFLRRIVFAADRFRCSHCGAGADLQVDHVFPWSLGGLTVFFNLVTLCGTCNRAKSNYWRYRRSGRAVYVPFPGQDVQALAAVILASERRHRRNPLRMLRAAWALG